MNQLKASIRIFIVMTALLGLAYPLAVALVSQLASQKKANGSLVQKEGLIIGSALIAQNISGERYFWPRPSSIGYDPLKPSGGSNLGPTSRKLKEEIDKRKEKNGKDAPGELLYASGSGLDPHISLDTAYFQCARVAKERSIDPDELKKLIDSFSESFALNPAGYVNVLLLNRALDESLNIQ